MTEAKGGGWEQKPNTIRVPNKMSQYFKTVKVEAAQVATALCQVFTAHLNRFFLI